ncbi:MAG: helix-turn-helix domain-containing protein [Erysipelotrichia bacterium]|nr:helix-turn-helix domain-containing protein [Erysipelotrichia bacterium]
MLVSNTSERLQYLMNIRKLKQIDILNKCLPLCDKYNVKMGRNHISQYVSGKVKPNQDKLSILAMALDVNEAWLMGYDVPMSNYDDNKKNITNSFAEKVGQRIQYLRQKRGLSIEELAKKTGITTQQLIDMENGVNHNFDTKLMLKFCEVLNVDKSYFVDISEPVDDIGENIKALREAQNLTMTEVANELHIDVDEYRQLEEGKVIPYDLLDKLSNIFNINVSMLIGIDFRTRDNENKLNTAMRVLQRSKRWHEVVGETVFSDEEMEELMEFAKYLISKRKDCK